MPFQTTIGRMTSVEFFAAMPPGLFSFLVFYACLASGLEGKSPPSIWGYLMVLSDALKQSPPMIFIVVFGAYLFGSIIRSMPVQWAESITSRGRSNFPYPSILCGMIDQIAAERRASGLHPEHLPNVGVLSTSTFNYWKDCVCIREPQAFVFYQSFEARSRFFAGMFWAGALGFAGSIYMAVRWHVQGGSYLPAIQLLVLSLSLILAFGLQLHRVREQEARVLLTLFVVVTQQSEFRSDLRARTTGDMGSGLVQ